MYNQGSDQEKIGMESGTPYIPPPSSQPLPPDYTSQPGGSPPQPGGYPPQQSGYPPVPVQQQPTHTSHNTTVVIQQQPATIVVQQQRGWSTGLCACFDDCGVCLLGFFCACVLECTVSSKAGECCCVAGMCPIALRTKIRTRHNITGSIMDDCCTMACCGPCAMCQMARELNTHGI